MRVPALADRPVTPALRACFEKLGPGPEDYRELAAILAEEWVARAPRRVGLGGGQGAGKSTLADLAVQACALRGMRAAALALDDFYLGRDERRALAVRVHPLFETRGPPGTHDIALLSEIVNALLESGPVQVPVFDKGGDDRAGWRTLEGPFDLVLLEGWCIGAGPLDPASLRAPINALERSADAAGAWRRYFADQLATRYAALFDDLDFLAFLRVPDLAAVRRWRLQQESERSAEQRMSAAQVDLFVAHYERITLSMLAELPERAELTVSLDADHAIADLRFR